MFVKSNQRVFSNLFTRIGTDSDSILKIPSIPGVYRFISDNQDILYIGASGNLQKRVSHYFRESNNQTQKHLKIKQLTRFIEFCSHHDSVSAFKAERIEIWTNQPVLNVRGNIVKSFSYLVIKKKPFYHFTVCDENSIVKITFDDDFYRINTHMKDLIEKMEKIRRKFPFCLFISEKSCWDYQLGLCDNVCRVKSDYLVCKSEIKVHELITELRSKESALILKWKAYIADYASKLQFEKANKFQISLEALKSLRCSYGGQCSFREIDQFSFGITDNNRKNLNVQIMSFQDGKNIIRKQESIHGNEKFTTEILVFYYLMKYYKEAAFLPNEILIDYPLSEELQNRFHKRIKRFYHRSISLRIVNSVNCC